MALVNLVWVVEPVGTIVTADTTTYSADNTIWPTADGGVLEGARDDFDATVEAAEVALPGGGYYRPPHQPAPVEGVGYGILPELEGDAHGVVVVAGDGVGALPGLVGEAAGTVGVTGRSAGQILVRAAAIGTRGQTGDATAVLKGLSVAGAGVVGTRGSGSGVIVKFQATAVGRHDDVEAAMMAFLLAA